MSRGDLDDGTTWRRLARLEADALGARVDGTVGGMNLEARDAAPPSVCVSDAGDYILLTSEAHAVDDPEVVASVGLELSDDQARDLAEALSSAVDEREARRRAEAE